VEGIAMSASRAGQHNRSLRDRSAAEQADVSVVTACLCLKLRMVARTTAVLYDKALKPSGLSSAQFSALRNIYRFVPLRISELSKVMLLERTTLTRNLELLQEQGLLELQGSTEDARVFTPVLTTRGVRTLKTAAPRWRLAQRRFFGGLGAAGWSQLLAALRAIAAINEQAPHRLYVGTPDALAPAMIEGPGVDLLDTQRCANSTLRGAARYVTREYDAALRDLGIKVTQLHVLAAIDENPEARPLDLATLLSLDKASMTLALAGLRRVGWVEIQRHIQTGADALDARSIALSDGGQAILTKARAVWSKMQTAKLSEAPSGSLLEWSAAIDNALVAALKAQIAL